MAINFSTVPPRGRTHCPFTWIEVGNLWTFMNPVCPPPIAGGNPGDCGFGVFASNANPDVNAASKDNVMSNFM